MMNLLLLQEFIIYGIIILLPVIYTHPIPKDVVEAGNSIPFTNIESILIVSVVFICTISVLVGCLCCERNVFKVLNNVHNVPVHDAYGNSNSGTEFTIFPPRGGNADESVSLNQVKFEPLPDIRPRGRSSSGSQRPRPANFCAVINRGLPVEDWFEDPSSNFPRNQLQYLQELGSGWFGQVVEGEAQGVNRTSKTSKVVVKILRDDATPTDQIYFLHEVRAFRDIDHPNVMKLLGKCLETDPFLVILEHCAFKDLKTYLIHHRTESESLIQGNILLRMMCNVSAGLSHMHKKHFVHTDLAARNCLVTNDLQVKIGDYGNSIEKFKDDYYCATDMAVPIRWCAPESLRCTETTIEPKEVTPESNMWSFGIVMWEILEFCKSPYTNMSEDDVLQKVVVEKVLTLSQPLNPCIHKDKIYQVMQLCWLTDPKLRPNMDKVHALLTHLHTHNASTVSDFESRWNTLQPRSNARLVNVSRHDSAAGDATTQSFETDFAPSSPQPSNNSFDFEASLSPSLQNLRGSLDDVSHNPTHTSGKSVRREFDQWLANQRTKGDEECRMARQISEAIVTLDAALAGENCTSSESNNTSPEREVEGAESDKPQPETNGVEPEQPDSLISLDGEKVTELVKEKSASVQDFLTLTIIDSDNSDTDVVPNAEGAKSANLTAVVDTNEDGGITNDGFNALITNNDDEMLNFRYEVTEDMASTPLSADLWETALQTTVSSTYETAVCRLLESSFDVKVEKTELQRSSAETGWDDLDEVDGFGEVCEAVNNFVMIPDRMVPLADAEDSSSGSTMYEVEDIDEALLDIDEDYDKEPNSEQNSEVSNSSFGESGTKFADLELKFVESESEKVETRALSDEEDEEEEVLVVDTETNEIMMFPNDKLPIATFSYQTFSELAPKASWGEEPRNDSTVSEVNNAVASTSDTGKSIFMWPGSSDEEEEVTNADLELPRPMAPEPNYPPDWESESESNSEETSSSSTSGEFDCSKSLEAKADNGQAIDVMEVNGESEESDGPSVRVSTWDKNATPKRSSLKISPEKKCFDKKSVSFEIAKNPFVYEYPKEKRDDPPVRGLWTIPPLQSRQQIDFTDWEMSPEDIVEEIDDFDDSAHASSTPVFKLNDQLLYRLSDVPVEELNTDDTDQVAFVDPLVGPITYRELFEHYHTARFYPPPYDEAVEDDMWLASNDFFYTPSDDPIESEQQETKTDVTDHVKQKETIDAEAPTDECTLNNNKNNNNHATTERKQNVNQELLI